MKNPEPCRGRRGFTLIELLVVLAVAMILMLMTIPAMFSTLRQGKLRGVAQETAVLMRQARLDAVKFSSQAVVRIVLADSGTKTRDRVEAFSDRNGDGKLTAGEPILDRMELPTGIRFLSPPDVEGASSVYGFTVDPESASNPKLAVFTRDGSIADVGAFRFADTYENYLEVRVAPAATARIELRKARQDGSTWNWYASGDGGEAWTWN
ncbi:MAG: type fimbrial biosis protein FimT [Acidobacteriota bacterium]|jgi:type IV fimbrial biogenesis protein FimT|nr:type fimbrial biosis protein FimT [Acidobacteriota bacterium]